MNKETEQRAREFVDAIKKSIEDLGVPRVDMYNITIGDMVDFATQEVERATKGCIEASQEALDTSQAYYEDMIESLKEKVKELKTELKGSNTMCKKYASKLDELQEENERLKELMQDAGKLVYEVQKETEMGTPKYKLFCGVTQRIRTQLKTK